MPLQVQIQSNLRLKEVLAQVKKNLQDEIARTAEDAADKARQFVPVLTGEVHDSIKATKGGKDGASVEAKFPAAFIEFGTKKMMPQPFMIPAIDMAGEDVIRRIENGGLL